MSRDGRIAIKAVFMIMLSEHARIKLICEPTAQKHLLGVARGS